MELVDTALFVFASAIMAKLNGLEWASIWLHGGAVLCFVLHVVFGIISELS